MNHLKGLSRKRSTKAAARLSLEYDMGRREGGSPVRPLRACLHFQKGLARSHNTCTIDLR